MAEVDPAPSKSAPAGATRPPSEKDGRTPADPGLTRPGPPPAKPAPKPGPPPGKAAAKPGPPPAKPAPVPVPPPVEPDPVPAVAAAAPSPTEPDPAPAVAPPEPSRAEPDPAPAVAAANPSPAEPDPAPAVAAAEPSRAEPDAAPVAAPGPSRVEPDAAPVAPPGPSRVEPDPAPVAPPGPSRVEPDPAPAIAAPEPSRVQPNPAPIVAAPEPSPAESDPASAAAAAEPWPTEPNPTPPAAQPKPTEAAPAAPAPVATERADADKPIAVDLDPDPTAPAPPAARQIPVEPDPTDGRLPIDDVGPTVSGGKYPAKAVVGEIVPVSATVYREGHDAVGCNVVWRDPSGAEGPFTRMTPGAPGTDRWHATFVPDTVGAGSFAIEAFSDPYLTWRDRVEKKIAAGQDTTDLANDIAEGAALLDQAAAGVPDEHRSRVTKAAEALRAEDLALGIRVSPALGLKDLLWEHPVRELVTRGDAYPVWVDRKKALFSAWYEFFPRSEGAVVQDGHAKHGTFATAQNRIPGVAKMGFDVLYLPPIHPIGRVNRKGRNNALVADEDDVGSPWAIGSEEGGHDAIHPRLGTLDDFKAFIAKAEEHGLEVAMDLALQCAPDHPWVKEHPEWFTTRADGSIAYAENPPKKYQDIYPLNFDNDPEGIRQEVRRVVLHWVEQGVKIFRVDNPHTKPVNFWHWLIAEVKAVDADVLFLAEAFTRPAVMNGLGKIGFSQSYTYFTWRTTAWEMREYCEQLVAAADQMRPNFWPNTPDILHESLQHGGPPMFKIRAVLASMLVPSWGMYAGFELFEHVARPGAEEYLDNEKYELRPRDWAGAEAAGRSLAGFLGRLNAVRRDNPALHWLRNLRFHDVDNPALLCWSKRDPRVDNTVLVICSFDSGGVQWGNTTLDMPALGLDWHERFVATDQLTGATYDWGQRNAVRLDPFLEPAHILSVRPRR